MTNEEKVIEICDKMGFHNEPFLRATYREDVEQAIEEGMQWKDEQHKQEKQQWIDKACEWFKNHAEDFIDDEGGTIMPYIEDECFVRFKKAMEDEL